MSGTLYVVATPIGNLADLSDRARGVLAAAAAIVCEDTRVSRKLLGAHRIDRPTVSFHAHSSDLERDHLLARLEAGEDLALVSDAGTPLLSDPGDRLVAAALDRSVPVVPVPGPSALLAALVGSGLSCQPFVFLGFLPRGRGEKRERVAPLAALDLTLVAYESAGRLASTLTELRDVCGPDRAACVARELTKRHETFERGSLGVLARRFADGTRGEVVIVVGPPDRSRPDAAPVEGARLEEEARRLLEAGVSPSEAAKTLAGALGVTRKTAYAAVLRVGAT